MSNFHQPIRLIISRFSLVLFISLYCLIFYVNERSMHNYNPKKIPATNVNVITSNITIVASNHSAPNSSQPSREDTLKSIDSRIEEELKYDKGTGCDIPKLDPFASEMMKFVRKQPKVVCEKHTDWVKCSLSKCRVVKKILDKCKDINCTYRDIIFVTDFSHRFGPPKVINGPAEYTLSQSDHVKVSCKGLDKSNKSVKWDGFAIGFRSGATRKPPPSPPGPKDLNVLILAFDTTSKNGFIRLMPKSYKVLTNELDAVVLNGYNIVGDATRAALFPLLTGKDEFELPDCSKEVKGTVYMDQLPFIFYWLRDNGYRTAYFEDMPGVGTFQSLHNGFKKQPADHYLRAFLLETTKTSKKYCCGDIPQYKMMLNITDQFFHLKGKHFALTFIADISHDDFNWMWTADDDVAEFLTSFKAQGRLRNTLLVVMGDHGPRYTKSRNTYQGKIEERKPLMTIVLPENLQKSRPDALKALEMNAEVLTTPRDIHATILDALDLQKYYNLYKVKGADLKRALSLLEPIPRNRSCSEAGIEPHWCACRKWTAVQPSETLYREAAQALVDKINSITEFVRSKCALRTLTSVEGVMMSRTNYQVKITVGPGKSLYEATVVYLKDQKKFTVSLSEISRLNMYGSEPSCISKQHPRLNIFCYCQEQNKNIPKKSQIKIFKSYVCDRQDGRCNVTFIDIDEIYSKNVTH